MIRKIAAIALAISFIAIATSGMMMFVIERPSFTIQMHPVHKLFGLVMIASALIHISLNYRALLNHLRTRGSALFGAFLVAALTVMYGVALNNEMPAELAEQMDQAAMEAESRH